MRPTTLPISSCKHDRTHTIHVFNTTKQNKTIPYFPWFAHCTNKHTVDPRSLYGVTHMTWHRPPHSPHSVSHWCDTYITHRPLNKHTVKDMRSRDLSRVPQRGVGDTSVILTCVIFWWSGRIAPENQCLCGEWLQCLEKRVWGYMLGSHIVMFRLTGWGGVERHAVCNDTKDCYWSLTSNLTSKNNIFFMP